MAGKILFFPKAEEVLQAREDKLSEIRLVLDDIEALVEVQHGLNQKGEWGKARAYTLGEMEFRLAALRLLLGAE